MQFFSVSIPCAVSRPAGRHDVSIMTDVSSAAAATILRFPLEAIPRKLFPIGPTILPSASPIATIQRPRLAADPIDDDGASGLTFESLDGIVGTLRGTGCGCYCGVAIARLI